MPHASQFSQVSTWKKLGKMVPVREHRQCLLSLANCPQGICVSMPFLFCMFSPFKKCSFLVKKILLIKQCIDSFLFFFHEFFPFF